MKKSKTKAKTRPRKPPSAPPKAAAPAVPPVKPRVFVGCSSEAIEVAKVVAKALGDVAEVKLWSEATDVFRPMTNTLAALLDACRDFYDFGVFLLHPDDVVESRGKQSPAPRDNVWFELGLFIGALGERRAFALEIIREERVKILSDLSGTVIDRAGWVGKPGADRRTAAKAVEGIANEIRHLGRNQGVFKLAGGWGLEKRKPVFYMDLKSTLVQRHLTRLRGQQLVVVGTLYDPSVDYWKDKNIDVGEPRHIDAYPPDEIRLTVTLRDKPKDARIDGFLFMLPGGVDAKRAKTMQQLRDWGGLLLESKGAERE